MVSESAKAAFADVTDGGNDGGPELFRSLNSSTFSNSTASTGGAINDRCSQAEAIVEANSTEPLNNRMVFHARQWTEKEIIDTALRRRGEGPASPRARSPSTTSPRPRRCCCRPLFDSGR